MGRYGSKKARYFPHQHPSNPPPPPPPPSEKKLGPIAIKALLASVEADKEACALLSVATTAEARETFQRYVIANHVSKLNFPQSKLSGDFFQRFTSWAGQLGSIRNTKSPNLISALAYCRTEKTAFRFSKQHFIETTGLNWKAANKEEFLSTLNVYREKARPRSDPYPPYDTLIAETTRIRKINSPFFHTDQIHDIRDHRRPIELLKMDNLQRDIKHDESAIIYDQDDGKLVGMVIRNVCKNPDAVEFVDRAVEEAVLTRKTCRVSFLFLADPDELKIF